MAFTVFGDQHFTDSHLDLCVQCQHTRIARATHFGNVGKGLALTRLVDLLTGHVIKPQHDILGRNDDRLAVRRGKHVVR